MALYVEPMTSEVLAEIEQRTARRRRWRRRGLVGVALLSTVLVGTWAAGVVFTTTTTGTVTSAPPLLVNPGGNPPSRFDAALQEHDALSIGFTGNWGVIAADTGMFDLDLTDAAFGAGQYYLSVVVLNTPNGWERLQVQFHAVAGACAASPDWTSPISSVVMYVETDDTRVNLTGLTGGGAYCIGVRAVPKADNPAATYIRRPSGSIIPTMPVFGATVGQSS